MTKKMLFHGECVINEIDQLPEGLTEVAPVNGYVRIAESEVTGNHHQVLVADKDVQFYEKDGVLYAKVNELTKVNCVLKERHDEVELPVGIYEFNKALEYDALTEQMRYVVD